MTADMLSTYCKINSLNVSIRTSENEEHHIHWENIKWCEEVILKGRA